MTAIVVKPPCMALSPQCAASRSTASRSLPRLRSGHRMCTWRPLRPPADRRPPHGGRYEFVNLRRQHREREKRNAGQKPTGPISIMD